MGWKCHAQRYGLCDVNKCKFGKKTTMRYTSNCNAEDPITLRQVADQVQEKGAIFMTESPNFPALDPQTVDTRTGSTYPAPFGDICHNREKRALGKALALSQFGVNLVSLPPGAASAQRHWHTQEDEFIYVLDGVVTLVTDTGEQLLETGMVAGFPGGKADGHQLINRSGDSVKYLEVGSRVPDEEVHYPDIDLHLVRLVAGGHQFQHKSGEPY